MDFGDTLNQQLSPRQLSELGNTLGITLTATTLRGVVSEIMIIHGKEDGTRWRNVKQNRADCHKIWLGQGSLVCDIPVIKGTTLQDTFVETSDTNIDAHTATGPNSGFSWVYTAGSTTDMVVIAADDNLKSSANIDRSARAESDLADDDHFCQFQVDLWATGGSNSMGPLARYDSAADKFYLLALRTNSAQYRIFKKDGGFTQLASATETLPSEPVTAYLEADGSSLDGKIDGTSKITDTDTTFTGQVRCGIFSGENAKHDNWKAEDLGAAAAAPVVRRRQLTTVRM